LGPTALLPQGPVSQAPVPDAKVVSTELTASTSGAINVEVGCQVGESTCVGTVTLRTLTVVSAAAAHQPKKQKPAILTLAVGSFKVVGGQVTTVKLRLSAKARALLAGSHVLRAQATITNHDPAGAAHTTQTMVTIHAAKATRRGRRA